MAASALSLSGARPRLVWMMTPVPLMTGRSVGAKSAASCSFTSRGQSWAAGAGPPPRVSAAAPAWRAAHSLPRQRHLRRQQRHRRQTHQPVHCRQLSILQPHQNLFVHPFTRSPAATPGTRLLAISRRVARMPAPRRLQNIARRGMARRPAQFTLDLFVGSDQMAGSPGRRAARLIGIGWPVTSRAVLINS